MTTDTPSDKQTAPAKKIVYHRGTSEAVYGLGLIGAWIYYLTHATTFWMGVLGILKGIVWPALVVYELMKFLGM